MIILSTLLGEKHIPPANSPSLQTCPPYSAPHVLLGEKHPLLLLYIPSPRASSVVWFVFVTRLYEASQTGEHPGGEDLLASKQTLLTVRVEDQHDHHWVWGQGSTTTPQVKG